MRKIKRGRHSCPDVLKPHSLTKEKKALIKYYNLPAKERRLSRVPVNNEKLFHNEVMAKLTEVFFDRCAWCESSSNESSLHIEHFRPKSNARGENDKSSSDHYGWFVYEWNNIFLCCKECSYAKANYFPVESVRAEPLSTWSEADALERVQLINPCKDDPLHHISISRGGLLSPTSEKGEKTIEVFKLNRPNLIVKRLNIINELMSVINNSSDNVPFFKYLINEPRYQGLAYLFLSLFLVADKKLPSTVAVQKMIKDILKRGDFTEKMKWLAVSELIWHEEYYRKEVIGDSYSYSQYVPVMSNRKSRRIINIAITNFKSLEDISLDLSSTPQDGLAACTMFLGENSTGKSSILQAISLAMMNKNERKKLGLNLPDYMTKDHGTWFNSNWNNSQIKLKFDDDSVISFEIDSDFNAKGDGQNTLVFLAYGARRYISKLGMIKATQSNRTLFDPAALIPNPKEWLSNCEPEQFESVARAMKEILSLKQDDNLYKDQDGNVYVNAHMRETPLEQMSDGYKSIFYVVLDIMRNMLAHWDNFEYATGIVLIDEIETHLHPRWKMQVVGALRRAMPNVQFIFTTHDPLCLRGMFDGEVHVLRRNSENKILEEKDLPNFQGLRTEQILTSDYFGLLTTNDPEVERKLEEYTADSSITKGKSPYIKLVEDELSQMTVLGKTLSQRVVHEALSRYLDAAKKKKHDAGNLKEAAINEILAILRKNGVKND